MLRSLRGRHESVNALATRSTVHDLAYRVGAASVLARVHAAMVVADGVHRTVLGTGAISFRLAAGHIRIAHVIGRALTHRVVGRAGNADRRRVTGVRTTRLHGDAFNVGHRIWTKSGRTLTDRSVIVRDADCVHAAGVLVAGVVAGVCQSVAELRRRTVDVVYAGHGAATGRRVVRIAGVQTGRALAVRHVIVNDAERVRAARYEVADQLTGERTVGSAATRLILRALAVRGAAILARTVTATAVVRIARVTRQTVATAIVILRHAARICRTSEAAAERHALEHAERVRPATLARATVVVAYAVGHRGFLAGRQYRIPLVSVLTLASGVTGYDIGLALLISAAHNFAAWIHAVAHAAVQDDAEGTRLAV